MTKDVENKPFSRITLYYALITLLGIFAIFLIEYFGFFEGINNYAYDLSFRLRGNKKPFDKITIVAIDEKTLDKLGRWPIRRVHYAKFLDVVRQSKIVLFDLVMAEPSPDDHVLTDAIEKHGRVIMPIYIDGQSGQFVYPQPFPVRGIGHVHLEEEIDGVIRKAYHTLSVDDVIVPSFTSAAWEIYSGETFVRSNIPQSSQGDVVPNNIMQLDPVKINYYGTPGTFSCISFTDIIDGKYTPDFFDNRIIIVGVTAVGIETSLLTPFSQKRNRMTGVEIHANLFNNLIYGNCIKDVNGWLHGFLCLIVAGLFFVFLLKLGEKRTVLFWLLSIVVVISVVLFLFISFNRWFSPAAYLFSLTLVFLTTYTLRLDEAARKLDFGYANVASVQGLKTSVKGNISKKRGLFSLFSPADINSKIHLVTEITDQLKNAYVQISKDLEAAAQIQKDLLPTTSLTIPGVKFEWFFYPSSFVAGDIFNYYMIDETHVGFYVADVSGHGVPAAMLAVTISKILTPSHKTEQSFASAMIDLPTPGSMNPAMVVKGANHFFASTARSDQYFTAVYGVVDISKGEVVLAQAGLPQPILLRNNGNVSTVGQGGFPIALMDGIDYEDEVIEYRSGDRLFLYSDGIIECYNGEGEQFSTERLMSVLDSGREEPLKTSLDSLQQALFQWRGGSEFDDDLTMLAIEFE